ncbi:MAG TPA: Dam family site-specific DNA-(adenine-N6)-methyltransferase [Firmicutes bacterium]|nr:Dam family site-specific DNA-(adenine-N6)-methyltransferase [Candidatus Fermentithermobacillaceae bacterium]
MALAQTCADVQDNAVRLRPPLKWAGGKRWLVPHLAPIWREHSGRRLVEPFCGGLAVTLGLFPRRALLNDINPHLINFFRWVRDGLTIDLEMRNDKALYYQYRNRFNELIALQQQDSKEAAALFYYLNRTGYNGLCRFNRSGQFNVPFGRYKNINYVTDFRAYQSALADWHFTCGDFEDVPVMPEDFIYADPPYDVQFTQYSKNGFSWDDQVRLANWLARHPGPVVASNQATPRIVVLYQSLGFRLEFLDAPRMISCTGDRTAAQEILATRGI